MIAASTDLTIIVTTIIIIASILVLPSLVEFYKKALSQQQYRTDEIIYDDVIDVSARIKLTSNELKQELNELIKRTDGNLLHFNKRLKLKPKQTKRIKDSIEKEETVFVVDKTPHPKAVKMDTKTAELYRKKGYSIPHQYINELKTTNTIYLETIKYWVDNKNDQPWVDKILADKALEYASSLIITIEKASLKQSQSTEEIYYVNQILRGWFFHLSLYLPPPRVPTQ